MSSVFLAIVILILFYRVFQSFYFIFLNSLFFLLFMILDSSTPICLVDAIFLWFHIRARSCEPWVLDSNLRYSLTTFHSLISPLSGQRLSKLLPYYPQTGLIMLYASKAVISVSLSCSQHIQERT